MLTIRDDQFEALAHARRRSVALALRDWLIAEHGDDPRHWSIAANTAHTGFELGFGDFSLLTRLTAIVALPAFPNLEGRWGEAVVHVLTDASMEAEPRLTFIERELLPRYLRGQHASDAF